MEAVHSEESVADAQLNWMKIMEQKANALKNFTSSLLGNGEDERGDTPLDIDAVSEELEQISWAVNKKLRFFVDHESHEIIVNVIDSETEEVVRTLPPEALRRIHHKIKESIGVLFDELI